MFGFYSRLIIIRGVQCLCVDGCVCVQHVAIVERVRLPGFLVLGKVPASGKLGLKRLAKKKFKKVRVLLENE